LGAHEIAIKEPAFLAEKTLGSPGAIPISPVLAPHEDA